MSPPWMPLYIQDYLGDTARLSTLEHGAYLLLIMAYWKEGGLPDDDGELAYIAGLADDEWQRMKPRIARLFRGEGGMWKHKRIDDELAKANERYERRANAGRRGGIAKHEASIARAEADNADAMPTQLQPQPHLGNLKVSCPKQVRTRKAYSDEFSQFWTDYPTDNLMSKSEAAKAWDRLTEEDQALVIASVPAFKAYCAQHPDYRPIHACRYLSQRRFEGFGNFVRDQQTSGKVWVKVGTPQFNAWNAWWQDTKGKSIPQSRGGWYVPAEFPPQSGVAA